MHAIMRATDDPTLHTPDLGGTATTHQVTRAICTMLAEPT